MTSLPDLQQYTELHVAAAPAVRDDFDYEIVLSRSQLAGLGFVLIALLSVFCGISYSIGKSLETKAMPVAQARVVEAPAVPIQKQSAVATAPLVGETAAGQLYLQVGIIEKGAAVAWAEGLRTHGLHAFVAADPVDGPTMCRVLVGPLPDPSAFQRAKNVLDDLGVVNFGRTF